MRAIVFFELVKAPIWCALTVTEKKLCFDTNISIARLHMRTTPFQGKSWQALRTVRAFVSCPALIVLNTCKVVNQDMFTEFSDKNKDAQRIYESYDKFRQQVTKWDDISEREYLNIR